MFWRQQCEVKKKLKWLSECFQNDLKVNNHSPSRSPPDWSWKPLLIPCAQESSPHWSKLWHWGFWLVGQSAKGGACLVQRGIVWKTKPKWKSPSLIIAKLSKRLQHDTYKIVSEVYKLVTNFHHDVAQLLWGQGSCLRAHCIALTEFFPSQKNENIPLCQNKHWPVFTVVRSKVFWQEVCSCGLETLHHVTLVLRTVKSLCFKYKNL